MKKKLVALLCSVMVLSMVGCGSEGVEGSAGATGVTDSLVQENAGDGEASVGEEEKAVLSDDLYSYQVSVNGEVYQIPMWYEELEAFGWEHAGDPTKTLGSRQSTQYSELWKWGEDTCFTTISNMAANAAPYSESEITEISFNQTYLTENDWEIILPGGIQMGVSTREDIKALYGEPESESDGPISWTMLYSKGLAHEIWLSGSQESGILNNFHIKNWEALEGTDDSVSSEVPESVKNYVAPESLGEDILSINFELDGHLYTLPCPVSELVANGFTVDMENENTVKEVASGWFEWAVLDYNGQEYGLHVHNYSPNATTPDNCFVTRIELSSDMDIFEIVLPGNIKKGMPESELLEVLAAYEYEVEASSSSYKSYRIYGKHDSDYCFIGVEDGVVCSMQLKNTERPEY